MFDGTECPIQKKQRPLLHNRSHSLNTKTQPVLIGVTLGGMPSYVSPGYGGSTSDHQIDERSNRTIKFNPTDSIMADKGFNVKDIFAPMDENIPTFLKTKNRMSGECFERPGCSKRVNAERVIGLGKTYKILCQPCS